MTGSEFLPEGTKITCDRVEDHFCYFTYKGRPAFMRLAGDAFNYAGLGEFAFKDLVQTVDRCECLDFQYGRLDEAAVCFERTLLRHA